MEQIQLSRGVFVGHPMPEPKQEVPNTLDLAGGPAWQALQRIHQPHRARPTGWAFNVIPRPADQDYACFTRW